MSARWVRKTTERRSRVTIAKEHLGHFNHYENNFLSSVVIGNKMPVHNAEPETKAESKQWKRPGSRLREI